MTEFGDVKAVTPPEGDLLIIECDRPLTMEYATRLKEHFDSLQTGRKLILLDKGMRVSVAPQLDRIEAKLDTLLAALREDEELRRDLEGRPLPPDRDEGTPL